MKTAVIGTGVIGRLRADTVVAHDRTQLVAVADVDQAGAEAVAARSGARAYTDYRKIFDSSEVDAVIISSPAPLHEEMTLAAFEAGAHVLIEKPLAPTVGACRRMVDAAAAAGKTLAVGFNHRFYPSMKFVKDTLEAGTIGKLDHVRIYGGHDGLANFRADWMYKSELSGGGAMMDVGLHMTDLARFFLGEVDDVYAASTGTMWNVDGSEDNVVAVFRANGVPVHYHATWNEWKGYRVFVEAYGDRGMVRGYYAPMFNLLITQEKPGGPRRKVRKFYPGIILREKFKGWQTTTLKTFEDELLGFFDLVDGKESRLATGIDGLRAVEIAQAVYESERERAAVKLAR